MKIVLTCGYNRSKHAIVLLHLFKRENITIDKCLIVSEYSIKRFRYYYNQLDKKEFTKKFKDRILGRTAGLSDEMKYINVLYKEFSVKETTVSEYCKKYNIKYKIVKGLNNPPALDFIGASDLAIYGGGGIVGKKMLEKFSIGVLNCHGGKLPQMRGMNVGEWSVYLNVPLVNTLHFMVRELDLGPIIQTIPHDYTMCKNIDQLRGLAINYSIYDLLAGVKKIMSKEYNLEYQKKEDGKQYFTMHPTLKNLVNKKLAGQ